MDEDTDLHSFPDAVRKSQHIVVVAGAGLSAASRSVSSVALAARVELISIDRNINFHGGGTWRSLDAISLATSSTFQWDPSLVWKFYHYRRVVKQIDLSYMYSLLLSAHRALQAQPNAAHMSLAKLFMPDYLKIVAPAAKSFHLITQNVDGLSVAALKSLAEQVSNNSARLDRMRMDLIIQMHGSLFDIVCTKCGHLAQDFSNLLHWVLRTHNAPTM